MPKVSVPRCGEVGGMKEIIIYGILVLAFCFIYWIFAKQIDFYGDTTPDAEWTEVHLEPGDTLTLTSKKTGRKIRITME